MSKPIPPPRFLDGETRREVREGLASAGYEEATVCRHLECEAWWEILRWGRTALLHRMRALPPGLAGLMDLFPLGLDLPEAEAETTLGSAFLGALVRSGLVEREGEVVRAAVLLTPVGGLLFASDRVERHAERAADFVLGPGAVTRHLADLTLRRPAAAALDLGCGAGVLGALCAAHAGQVVATDVNARAVAFSRFNVELNGLRHVEVREGSLFGPVAGERFDLIVCNPPYVISPGETFVYRDGGTELCRSIVRGAPDHLTQGGVLEMMAEWPEGPDGDWKGEVGSWLEGTGCDAWVLRAYSQSPPDYAARWLVQQYPRGDIPQDEFDAWTAHLDSQGVRSVGGGLIVLRAARRKRPMRLLREAPPIVPPAGASLARWLEAQDLLADLEDDVRLLDAPLAPSPDLVRRENRLPTGDGWTSEGAELRLRQGLAFGARVDPVAAELVGLLDGRRSPREAMGLLADRYGVPVDPFLGGLPGALRRLVALGILIPGGGAGSLRDSDRGSSASYDASQG